MATARASTRAPPCPRTDARCRTHRRCATRAAAPLRLRAAGPGAPEPAYAEPIGRSGARAARIATVRAAARRTSQQSRPDGRLHSGASRARTDDLSAASRTLSQLSYSPKLEVARPVYPNSLIVLRRAETEVEHRTPRRDRDRHEVATVE